MHGFGKRTVDATVIIDSGGSILWAEIDDALGTDDGERISDGHDLEPGQREVKVRIPFDSTCINADKLMAKVRAKVGDLSKKSARKKEKR